MICMRSIIMNCLMIIELQCIPSPLYTLVIGHFQGIRKIQTLESSSRVHRESHIAVAKIDKEFRRVILVFLKCRLDEILVTEPFLPAIARRQCTAEFVLGLIDFSHGDMLATHLQSAIIRGGLRAEMIVKFLFRLILEHIKEAIRPTSVIDILCLVEGNTDMVAYLLSLELKWKNHNI